MLAYMLYLHVSLSRSWLCHALCPPWVCACVVTSVSPRVCMDVTICEIHLRGVGVLVFHLSPLRAMLICLPCLFCTTCLAFFASLHTCLHVHAWVYVLSIFQSYGTTDTWSKPTFVLLGHPLLFNNMLLCPFRVVHMLFCPCLASLLACPLHTFPISFFCFFACLLACLFFLCMYTHGCERKDASPQRAMISRLGVIIAYFCIFISLLESIIILILS